MPRYASFQIKSAQALKNSPPINENYRYTLDSATNYGNLSNDLRLSWDGDLKINPDTGDYEVAFNLEAFTQRLYRRLITQAGTFPGNSQFGWDFEYLFSLSLNDQKKLLPAIVEEVRASVESDPEIASLANLSVFIENIDNYTHKIVIDMTVLPIGVSTAVNLTLEQV